MKLLFYYTCCLYLVASGHALSSVSNFPRKQKTLQANHHNHNKNIVQWRPIREDSTTNFFTPSYHHVAWRNWRHEKLEFWKSGAARTRLSNRQHWDTGLLVANITTSMNPSLVVELAQPEKCVRLSSTRQGPFLWYRVDLGWYGGRFVRRSLKDLDVVPKIKSCDIEEYREALLEEEETKASFEEDTPAFYRFWAQRFANALSSPTSGCNPLTEGFWQLRPRTYSPEMVQTMVDQQFHSGYMDFDHPGQGYVALTLRRMSHPENGRVKWWRKKAKEGLLPPILVWKFSGLGEHFVLDGHDRLLAASLEHKPIDAVCLLKKTSDAEWHPVPNRKQRLQREAHDLLEWDSRVPKPQQGMRTEIANRLLSEAHSPQLFDADSHNMVGSMGTSEQWKEEVMDYLAKAYGSQLDFDDHFEKMFVEWGQAEDNAFWEPLINQIPHRRLAQIWKD